MKKASTNTESNNIKLTIQEPKRNFIILYDSVYKNTELTTDELALIIKLLACAPNFKPTKKTLSAILKIDERRLIKASKGLQDKGYLKIKKFGKSSEWIITQEPTLKLEIYNKEIILNALIDLRITPKDVKEWHTLKLIDDKLFINVITEYADFLKRIVKNKDYLK